MQQHKCVTKQYGRPVIIIAAARSGTKMLREVLAQSATFVEFSYDMNYIWLYRNYKKKHDELTKNDLTPDIRNFIWRRFEKLLTKSSAERVLEKSVPNSLRVEFVKSVFPDAQIIHLYRNGIDVAADAMQCWQSSLFSQRIQKKRDLFRKVVTFPYLSAWPYLNDYLSSYVGRVFSKGSTVQSWGPRYKQIDDDVNNFTLIEVCGLQWAHSVDCALKQLSVLHENNDFINVKYENLVNNPEEQLFRICNFIGVSDVDNIIKYGQENIKPNFINFHNGILSKEDKKKLMPHIESSLIHLGYQGE